MKNIYLIVLATLLFSCSGGEGESGPDSVKNTDSALFREFLKEVPDTNLPMVVNCGFLDVHRIKEKPRFAKYLSDYIEVVAKYKWQGKIILVFYGGVADIYFPIICSYDESGNLLDSLGLHGECCYSSTEFESSSFASISNTIDIIIKDTIKTFLYYEDDTSYKRTLDSVISTVTEYKMNAAGKFEHIKKEKKITVER